MAIFFESDPYRRHLFSTAVSLHSHTNHSRESLGFIYRYAAAIPVLRAAVAHEERKYRDCRGSALDFNRAWWTPPLTPHDAWLLERGHIHTSLGMNALVSLSDHDDIEACMSLRVLNECRHLPVSVEWTVPYGGTFFHLGLHNLPASLARSTMRQLAEVTAHPTDEGIREALSGISAWPDSLIVFNHPCWDESHVGASRHTSALLAFISRYREHLHGVEINGLRPWVENQAAQDLAARVHLPVVSGGDRHALEPNTVLNLSSARTFGEFAGEVRDGHSNILVTRQYQQPFNIRVLHSIAEILNEHWMDRVFYRCDDGIVRSMTEVFSSETPASVRIFAGLICAMRQGIRMLRWSGIAHSKSQPC